MQWFPHGLPLRRWVKRCISRFFSTNNSKNIYVHTATPDMHLVCDIFTFLDNNVFYVAYKGKSITWFINSVYWNCSQTVDPPLPKYIGKSLVCLQHFFPSNNLPSLSARPYSRGQKEGSWSKEETFRSNIFLFFFCFFQTSAALTSPKDQLALLIFNPSALAFWHVLSAFCWTELFHAQHALGSFSWTQVTSYY